MDDQRGRVYEIRPLYEPPKITDKPKCMYYMTSLYQTNSSQVSKIEVDENVPVISRKGHCNKDLTQLEERQKRLIGQLEELTKRLQQIKQQMTEIPAVPDEADDRETESWSPKLIDGTVTDVVVTVSPSHNPAGLLILLHWLKSKHRVSCSSYIHSSVINGQKQNIANFQREATNSNDRRTSQQIIITLIWKDVGVDPRLIVSPSKQGPICGEVNVIRYLASFLAPLYQFSDPTKKTEIDSWLDAAHASIVHGQIQQRRATLAAVESHLSHRKYLSPQQLTGSLKSWAKNCLENAAVSDI